MKGSHRLSCIDRTSAWLTEFWMVVRFGLVGLLATAIHLSVVWWLIAAKIPALPANLIAFLSAFVVSFIGHYHWSFRSRAHPARALARFFVIAGMVLLANSTLLTLLLRAGWPSTVAAFTAAAMVPVLNYLAGRLWVFRDPLQERPA